MVRELNPQKRELLLKTALKLFASNGVQKTSTAEISREAGTASGTLFLYFPTKQLLVDELVLMISKLQSDYINSILDPSLPVRDLFFLIWDGSIQWLLANPDAYKYAQLVREPGLVSEEIIQKSGEYFAFYYVTIQRGLIEGRTKPSKKGLNSFGME
jgi:AcrR family transcriptional regulator